MDFFQSPTSALGKSIRDAILFGLASGAIILIQSIDGVDFGQYDVIVSAVAGFLVTALNRFTRK